MRIVHSIYSVSATRGGPARVLRDLAPAQAAAGARVSLVTGSDGRDGEGLILPNAAFCETMVIDNPPRLYFPGPGYRAAIRARLADTDSVLHDHGIWLPSNWLAARAAQQARRPYVVSPHGSLAPWAMAWHGRRKQLVWHLYQRRVLAGARALVATSEDERAAIHALFPGKPVALLPNGVAAPESLPDRRHLVGRPARQLLFLSRLHPVKNLPGLIAAWALAKADPALAGWTLTIAGPDELGERGAAAAQATAAGVGDTVRFLDSVAEADKAALFAQSDLFILPSFTENFGIVVAEALGQGVPAIATHGTPWGDLPRLDIGWHVAPTPEALAGAMTEAMRLDDERRLDMGARGHAHVRDRYGWARIAADSLALYDWVLHGGARPACVDG